MASPKPISAPEDEAAKADAGTAGEKIRVETRFGTMEFDKDKVVTLTHGLLGFPGHLEFALADLPEDRFGQFKVLQSITDPDVSFPVLSLEYLPGLIEEADIHKALKTLGISLKNSVVLLIATARKDGDTVKLSVNLRAPILMDAESRTGRQYVLANTAYPIRHVL